jgi:thiamine transport system permease protein
MLMTRAQRRRGIGWGLLSLIGIGLFVGIAIVALLSFDAGNTQSRLFTAYTGRILRFTLLQAVLSTLLSVVFALPVALALARRPRFPGRVWVIRLMALPMGLPVLIGALGLIGIWGRQGVMNSLLLKLGLEQPVSIYGLSGILLAHVFFNLPLAARLLLAALERLPAEYWLLSSSLGMKPFSVFRFIEWPAARRVIPGIAGLIFMLCATSFTLVLVLGGGPAATTLEVAIYQSLRFDFDPPRAIALSLLQIGITALILIAISLFPAPDDSGITAGRATRRFDGRTWPARLWDTCAILLATAFLVLPLASIAAAGVHANLWNLATSPAFLRAAWTSFVIALSAGLLAVLTSLAIIAGRGAVADMKRAGGTARTFSISLGGMSSLVLLVPPVVLGTGLVPDAAAIRRCRPFRPGAGGDHQHADGPSLRDARPGTGAGNAPQADRQAVGEPWPFRLFAGMEDRFAGSGEAAADGAVLRHGAVARRPRRGGAVRLQRAHHPPLACL